MWSSRLLPRFTSCRLGAIYPTAPTKWCSTSAKPDNHYSLLGLTEQFSLDTNTLATRFKDMQRRWHPDKFAMRSSHDQHSAAAMSAKLNVAYDVLRVPHRRAKYLLRLRTSKAQSSSCSSSIQEEAHPPQDFLVWVMHFREQLDDARADVAQLRTLRDSLQPEIDQCLSTLTHAFQHNHLEDAAIESAKLQYFASIQLVFDEGIP